MISIPALLFLAQAAMVTTPVSLAPTPTTTGYGTLTPSPQNPEPQILNPLLTPPSSRLPKRHDHSPSTPLLSPQIRITIVNATSVPSIALSTKGPSLPVAYPSFPQGEWTADAPLKTSAIHYLVRNSEGHTVADRLVTLQPLSDQILLLTGDLSTSGPPDTPPQIGLPPLPDSKPWPPNLQFHLYPCDTGTNDRCRYRVVNGMPSKLLILRSIAEPNRPSQQLALLAPGNSALFVHQPPNLQWEAEIDGQMYPIAIEQEGEEKNCLIPFFLRNGHPDCIRVFEDP